MTKIKITTQGVHAIDVGDTIRDDDLVTIIRNKMRKKDKSLLMSPYVHTYYIEHTNEKGYVIGAIETDSKIQDLIKYFQEIPPMNNTRAIFTLFKDNPSIMAIKDGKEGKWLGLKETENLCKSIGWEFYEPLKVEDLELLMQLCFSCTESYLRTYLWHGDKLYKLFTYDTGLCMPLFLSDTWIKRMKETNKSMVWYWLCKQSWVKELQDRTSAVEPIVDKIWKTLTI